MQLIVIMLSMEVIKINNNPQNKLKAYRVIMGLTLEAVAKVIGVNKTTIQRYESGAIPNIPIETIKALSKLYGVSVNELLDIRINTTTKDLFVEFIESLNFKCMYLNSESAFTTIESENQSILSMKIQTPNGDDYEVTQNDLTGLKVDLQDYLEFQFYKLNKKK